MFIIGAPHYPRKIFSKEEVCKQLKDRSLRHLKYYPIEDGLCAFRLLDEKVRETWYKLGYPNARHIKGEEIVSIYKKSLRQARKLYDLKKDSVWIKLIGKMGQSEEKKSYSTAKFKILDLKK